MQIKIFRKTPNHDVVTILTNIVHVPFAALEQGTVAAANFSARFQATANANMADATVTYGLWVNVQIILTVPTMTKFLSRSQSALSPRLSPSPMMMVLLIILKLFLMSWRNTTLAVRSSLVATSTEEALSIVPNGSQLL